MVSLKSDHLFEKKFKKTEYFHWPCSSRKDQILTIWYFDTTANSDLNINNMTNKKMIEN